MATPSTLRRPDRGATATDLPPREDEPAPEVPPPHRPIPDGEPVTPIIPGRGVPEPDD